MGRSRFLRLFMPVMLEGYTLRVVSSHGLDKGTCHEAKGTNDGCTYGVAPSCEEGYYGIYDAGDFEGRSCRWQLATSSVSQS